jgi:predicted DNA-binding antitoxin AbrB/MazE fold protein
MTFRGVYKDGVVIVSGDVDIPNGSEVDVHLRRVKMSRSRIKPKVKKKTRSKKPARTPAPTLNERLASVIGMAKGLPPDASRNIDHYLYGAPKR